MHTSLAFVSIYIIIFCALLAVYFRFALFVDMEEFATLESGKMELIDKLMSAMNITGDYRTYFDTMRQQRLQYGYTTQLLKYDVTMHAPHIFLCTDPYFDAAKGNLYILYHMGYTEGVDDYEYVVGSTSFPYYESGKNTLPVIKSVLVPSRLVAVTLITLNNQTHDFKESNPDVSIENVSKIRVYSPS